MLATALQLALALSVVSQQPCREPQCLCPTAAGFGQCNLADTRKRPPVSAALPKGPSIETGIANHTAFEHALGHALRSTAAVQHATREFGARLFTAFVEPFSEGYSPHHETFRTPDAIFANLYDDPIDCERCIETVTPIAQNLSLSVNSSFGFEYYVSGNTSSRPSPGRVTRAGVARALRRRLLGGRPPLPAATVS